MQPVVDILNELEANGSRLAKEDILEHNCENDLLKDVLVAALDPYVNYGIAKWKMPKPVDKDTLPSGDVQQVCSGDASDFALASFLNMIKKLQDRTLSGNAAREATESVFAQMDSELQKWCKRILIKNLRAGIQSKTVNKTWPNLIPEFTVQLAKPLETLHDQNGIVINEVVNYPVRIEPKLDGLRCVAIKTNGVVTMYTRNGREISTLDSIKDVLEAAPWDHFVLDGEAMGEDWNESASIVGSKKNRKSDRNIVFHVFDGMSFSDWSSQSCASTLVERQAQVKELLATVDSKNVKPVQGVQAADEEELMVFYEKCLDEGYEGIMIKDLAGLYTFKRTTAMLKMKPVTTYEGAVVGHYNGRDGTKHQGVFGGFDIVLPNGVVTRVGGGFSDSERAAFQTGLDKYMGMIMEVEGQPPLTKEGKIRFPVFVRWRDTSDVDPKVIEAYERYDS